MRASLRAARAHVNRRASRPLRHGTVTNPPCRRVAACYLQGMAEASPPTALVRIERALARIEAAVAKRDTSRARLIERHETLRRRMAEAIAALDVVLEREQS